MYEVTIPLRPVQDSEIGNPDDYYKIIKDEYASRYLALLNIAATPANKADFMRYRMMDDCDMMAVWPDMRTSALADAIRIVPPLRQRLGDLEDFDECDRGKWAQWYGQSEPILVRQPEIAGSTGIMKLDTEEDDRNADAAQAGLGTLGVSGGDVAKLDANPQPGKKGDPGALAAEMERNRVGGAVGGIEVGKKLGGANSKNDEERRERQKQELVSLKAKYILPFACERPAKEGCLQGPSKKSELVVWPMQGPLNIDAPQDMWDEVLQPIRITLEDVRKNTCKWVDEQLPMEFLSSRKDEGLWEDVRETLRDADVARLTGLLAHLLHWVSLMPNRTDGPQLSESALQSLFVAIHENWSQFEKRYRDSKVGVSFALPCLMLTVKRGIERSFEISYPTLMSHELLRQQVLDRINTLLMRLFDPDGTYSRFGKFDGEGKAIQLSKKLDALMASTGNTHVKRLHGRMHRATPLVRAVLGLAGSGVKRGTVADTNTRVMMLQSDLGGTVMSGSVVDPPQDRGRQSALLTAAMKRLPVHCKHRVGEINIPGSPRQLHSARVPISRRVPKLPPSPLSARAGEAVIGGAAVTASSAASGLEASASRGGGASAWAASSQSTGGSGDGKTMTKARGEPDQLPKLQRPPRPGKF